MQSARRSFMLIFSYKSHFDETALQLQKSLKLLEKEF